MLKKELINLAEALDSAGYEITYLNVVPDGCYSGDIELEITPKQAEGNKTAYKLLVLAKSLETAGFVIDKFVILHKHAYGDAELKIKVL